MSDKQLINRLRDSRYLSQHHSFENVAALCEEAADRIKQLTVERDEAIFQAKVDCNELTIERDAALAEVDRLREGLVKLRDCDFVITPADRMDAVREIAREALKEQP